MSDIETARRPSSLATHLKPLRRSWRWLMGAGVALVVLGVIGLAMSFLFSLAGALSFGLLALFAGGAMIADGLRAGASKERWWSLLIGAAYIGVGALIVYDPLSAVVALTLVAGAMLVAVGALRIALALALRPAAPWGFVLASGILGALLGVLILLTWPASSLWVLGTFLAIEFLIQGFASIMLARAIRSTFDGVTARAPSAPVAAAPLPSPGRDPQPIAERRV